MTPEQKLIRRWLKLAVFMLLLSGVFSLIVVFARTPGLYDLPHIKKLFHEALVIHVDLLVLCWPLCMAGLMWAICCPSKLAWGDKKFLNALAMLLIVIGALKLVASPLDISAEPLKNNYVPMITASVFINGLLLIAAGAAIASLHAVFFNKRDAMMDVSLPAVMNWGARGAAIITLYALVAIYLGFKRTSHEDIDLQHYYECAFWAGGHIFQYAFTQLAMLAWLWVFISLSKIELKGYQLVRAILLLNVAIGSLGIYGILAYDTLSFEYNQFYTNHMIIGGGIAPVLLLGWMLIQCLPRRRGRRFSLATKELSKTGGGEHPPQKARQASSQAFLPLPLAGGATHHLRPALMVSIGLFLYGGFLGLMIQGQDVTIPAHYHGSTISVTIALMGFAYAYMPQLSQNPLPIRAIKWQPIIYGGGQFMHITGLAISGGYGALRKTPGVEGTAGAKAAMGIMGLGGLLAVIGGLMFVYIMWRCLREKSQ